MEKVVSGDSDTAQAVALQTEIETMTPARDVLTLVERRVARPKHE